MIKCFNLTLFKQKIEELSKKLSEIIEENTQLHSKLDKVNFSSGLNDSEDSEL